MSRTSLASPGTFERYTARARGAVRFRTGSDPGGSSPKDPSPVPRTFGPEGRKMHADEVETDTSLVGRLLTAQFPQWAALPIRPVPFWGTDNALYRLGD